MPVTPRRGELAGHVDELAQRPAFHEALDVGVRERGLAHRRLVRAGRDRHPTTQLAVHLHHHLDAVALERRRIRHRPALVHDRARVAERAPERVAGVRDDRREHQHDELERLLHQGPPCGERSSARPSPFMSSITAAIAVLKVRRRPTSVVTLASVRVPGGAARAALRRVRPPRAPAPAPLHVLVHGLPQPLHESERALHALVRPLERLLGGAANIMNRRAVSAP